MCLYPKLIKNRKYTENKKNHGLVPVVNDPRTLYVPVGCQNCIECRKQKSRQWQVRLQEDIKTNTNAKFITLTFSNENYSKLAKEFPEITGYALDNAIATKALRWFLERWRKEYKKSLRHWLVTELGHNGTENIHLHGLIWTNETVETVTKIWQYGYMWPRYDWRDNYVNERTINYITKYVSKQDLKHKGYKAIVLTSPGIGSNYINTTNATKNKFTPTAQTNETYKTNSGHKINLPIYYRNKLYTDEQKETLWIQKLDTHTRFVCGEKVDVSKTQDHYLQLQKWYRERAKELGYTSPYTTADQIEYEQKIRTLKQLTRINNNNNNNNKIEELNTNYLREHYIRTKDDPNKGINTEMLETYKANTQQHLSHARPLLRKQP